MSWTTAADVVAAAGQRLFAAGQFGEGEVEQLDPHPGLADVDADEARAVPGATRSSVRGRPPSESTEPASSRTPSASEFGDYVADRPRAEPGGRSQLLSAERASK